MLARSEALSTPDAVLTDPNADEVVIPLTAGATTGIELDLSWDASSVALEALDLTLPDGWMVIRNDEAGRVRLAAVGVDAAPAGEVGHAVLKAVDGGARSIRGTLLTAEGLTYNLAPEVETVVPDRYELEGNYPNPFNPSTTIRYALPEAADVRIEVYNSLGQKVSTVFTGRQDAGTHDIVVTAGSWPTGLYVYRIRTDSKVMTGTMLLLK
jgi:hypothetical protein